MLTVRCLVLVLFVFSSLVLNAFDGTLERESRLSNPGSLILSIISMTDVTESTSSTAVDDLNLHSQCTVYDHRRRRKWVTESIWASSAQFN
ncbi:hypothetical protein SISSUDRAFT_1048957 [Sistotremastrum suecicum HHB10207 ss-3]|uniref:Secreted protein n=1 Tax=Sistotremastrum suecicum HHB10207 ss-3 TaxID=1314776 RepID=A0A166C5X1_9AGAM|nr:hypothetical protein SISSUDRAFT_1048957 [Sistotremastrum suecicum HHB10207 ss-3]